MRMARCAATAVLALSAVLGACSDDNDDEPQPVSLAGAYFVTALSINGVGQTVVGGSGVFDDESYDVEIDMDVDPGAGTTIVTATSVGDYVALDDGSFTQDGVFDADGPAGPTPPNNVQCTGTWSFDDDTGILDITANCSGGLVIETTLLDESFAPVLRSAK
jgi:hypothetical protein